MNARGMAATVFLLCFALPADAASSPSWRTLAPGLGALTDGGGSVVCSSIAALQLPSQWRRNCAVWKGGTRITIVRWYDSRRIPFEIAEVVRSDGKRGFTPVALLLPIVPKGTEIVLQRPCYPVLASAIRARVVSEFLSGTHERFLVESSSGARQTVSIYDVTDEADRPIFDFRNPHRPDFHCG